MSTKNRTRRTTTRNIRFPNQMIEQINVTLRQKSLGISRPVVPFISINYRRAYVKS